MTLLLFFIIEITVRPAIRTSRSSRFLQMSNLKEKTAAAVILNNKPFLMTNYAANCWYHG